MNPSQAQTAAAEVADRQRRAYPPIEDALLEALSREFPDRCPKPGTPHDLIMAAAGAAQVVRWLQHVQDYQRGRLPELTRGDDDATQTFQDAMIGDLDRV